MGVHTQPDITAPVTRGQSASTGITQNIGTSMGSSTAAAGATSGGIGGFTNNSLGGTAYNGIQSTNQMPTSRGGAGSQPTMAVVANLVSGGGSFATSTSSVNPVAIREAVTGAINSEYVALTTAGTNVASSTVGADTIQPKSAAVELPTNTPNLAKHISPAATIGALTTISYEGLEASVVTGEVDDNTINKNKVPLAKAEAPKDKFEDGANAFGPQGLPTSSVQKQTQRYENQPNTLIPFENNTASKP